MTNAIGRTSVLAFLPGRFLTFFALWHDLYCFCLWRVVGGMAATEQKEQAAKRALAGLPSAFAPSTFSAVQIDLRALIDPRSLECLNESAQHRLADIMAPKPAKKARLQSDVDPQLLISMAFTQKVRVTALALRAPAGPAAPRRLQLYVNRPHMDFAAVEAVDATAVLELSAEDVAAGRALPLTGAAFANVSSLTVRARPPLVS